MASDHIDGPVTISNSVADIVDLYAFPSPDHPGHLVLVMDVYTGASADGHFSEKVDYNFLIRNASIRGSGEQPGYHTRGDYKLSFSFETPHGDNASHWVTCTSSNGTKVRVKVDDTNGFSTGDKLGVFAGRRSDPFFYNSGWGGKVIQGNITKPSNTNLLKHLNVLSVLVIIDVDQELDMSQGPLLAVAAQSLATDKDNTTRQIDRLGRPEMTNIVMNSRGGADIRDLYNSQNTFNLNRKAADTFQKRLQENLTFFNGLNKENNWSDGEINNLTDILLHDFLVIDTSKPYSESSYFDIEYSILRGEPHTSPGGRSLNDDVIDVLFNMMINAGQQPSVTDGVSQATQKATTSFPYLAAPNGGIVANFLNYATRGVRYFTGSKAQVWTGVVYFLPFVLALVAIIMLLFFVFRLRKATSKMRMGQLLIISIMLILAAILGVIGHSLPLSAIVAFGIMGVFLWFFYFGLKK